MGSRLIKRIVLITFVTIVTGIAIWYFGFRKEDTINQSPAQVDEYSTTSIHIFNNTPSNLKDIIEDIANNKDWVIKDESADIFIGITNEEPEFAIYQFLIPTKPWTKLAQEVEDVIGSVSDSIDQKVLESLDQDYFEVDYSSVNGVELKTLYELDSTVISVPINGRSVFDSSWWEEINYPFTIKVSVWGENKEVIEELRVELSESSEFSGLGYTLEYPSADDFVEIIKTGTTVAGGPGWELCENRKGEEYPIEEAEDVLKNADLTIISNESSFVDGCSQGAGTTSFCGKPKYINNLLESGVDIVSLTGNHMNDYGRDYFSQTLDIYKNNNLHYFASGKNSTEAWSPLSVETEAGKITFIGYNRMGPNGVIATETLTGTAYYTQEEFLNSLELVPKDTDILWLDTHLWPEYGTTPTQEQVTLTREAVDNGIDIVTGVSSHEPQSITFYEQSPIFYGLGNFWFDQMWSEETRTGIALRVYAYENKIRSIEILPTKMYDYCQPRFLKGQEKQEILEYLVEISNF